MRKRGNKKNEPSKMSEIRVIKKETLSKMMKWIVNLIK